MSEQAIVTAKANVMVYDDQAKKWNPSGSSPGMSKVQIFQHLLNQSYRVVGRKLQDHEVVINCLLAKGLKYNQANQTFLQWRDAKQVYGLHFQSKEEADVFAQTLKLAVDNLNRLAAVTAVNNSNNINGNGGSGSSGDNISLGKRSTTSSDYNQSIYDENDRPYNMNPNAMMNHHQNSSSNLYATQGVGQLAQMRQLQQQQQQQQQPQAPNLVTATALSTSTSSCSSTSSTGSGLTISINNQNGHNSSSNLNGHNYNRQTSGVNEYNFNANGAPALTNLNPYNIHQQQQASIHNHQQQPVAAPPPMYQSSPIQQQQQPPVPPPIPPQLFATNNNNIDQYSAQKIYDVIPDTGNYPSSGPSTVAPVAQPPVPPPLPVGLFSGLNGPSAGPVPPPPPPPPPPPSLNGHNGTNGSSSNSLMSEIARAQGGKTLKKVGEESSSSRGDTAIRAAPMDFLAEIKQKFEKKNQQQQQQNGTESNHSPTESSSSSSHNGLGQQRKSSVQLNKSNGQQSNGGHFESPKAIKKITSASNVVNNCTNNSSNGSSSSSSSSYTNGVHVNGSSTTSDPYSTSINMEKLKQELVIEFRKELQSFKSDIINAILNELRR